MIYRDIIVDATPRDDLVQTLEQARDLAAKFDARLTALCFAWPRTSALRTAVASSPLSVREDTRRMDAALAGAHEAFVQVFGSGSKAPAWLSGMAEPAPLLRHLPQQSSMIATNCMAERPKSRQSLRCSAVSGRFCFTMRYPPPVRDQG